MKTCLRFSSVFSLLTFLLVSCALATVNTVVDMPDVSPEGAASKTTTPDWKISLQVNGGVAGRDERLEMTSAGRFRVEDRRRGSTWDGRLTAAQLDNIEKMLVALTVTSSADRENWLDSRCRDCLVVRLDWYATGKSRSVQISSDRLEKSPYRKLISALLKFMRHTIIGMAGN